MSGEVQKPEEFRGIGGIIAITTRFSLFNFFLLYFQGQFFLLQKFGFSLTKFEELFDFLLIGLEIK